MVFPCNCRLIVHENCAQVIRRMDVFRCPTCGGTYSFPLYTPGTSVISESVLERPYRPQSVYRYECASRQAIMYNTIGCLLLLIMITVAIYIYITYFR
jgi:hypothetical protein